MKSFFEATVVSASGGVAASSSRESPPSSDSPTSRFAWSSHGLAAAIVGWICSTLGVSAIARARKGGRASDRRASDGFACSTVGASSAIVALRLVASAASAPAVTLKLVIRSRSWVSWPCERREHRALCRDQAGEVVRADPEQRLVDDRGRAPGRAAVAKRRIERLGAGLALDVGVLGDVGGGGRLVGERRTEPLQRLLKPLAIGLLERGQDLVDLHCRSRLADRDRVAVAELGRARAARGQVEEEVALEEQPRADLDRRVLMDRLTLVVDGEGDARRRRRRPRRSSPCRP